MPYTVNVTKFRSYYPGDSIVSSYTYDDLEAADRAAGQYACMSFSDSIEIIDEYGRKRAHWNSLYNYFCRYEENETVEQYFDRHFAWVIQDITKHFIPELSACVNERTVSFIDGGKDASFTVTPGTEMIFWDACMDAGCKAEDAEQDGILDFSAMKTLMATYAKELSIRQQRYEDRKERELARPPLF